MISKRFRTGLGWFRLDLEVLANSSNVPVKFCDVRPTSSKVRRGTEGDRVKVGGRRDPGVTQVKRGTTKLQRGLATAHEAATMGAGDRVLMTTVR